MSMRSAHLAILSLVLLTPGAGADESPRMAAEILELEAAWNQAHLEGDVDTLDEIWAPDLTVIVPEMPPFSKEDLLEMWRSMKVAFSRYETSNVRVRIDGSTAVVTGRLQRSRDFGGRTRDEDWLFTKTYAKVGGAWRVIAYHASVTPAP